MSLLPSVVFALIALTSLVAVGVIGAAQASVLLMGRGRVRRLAEVERRGARDLGLMLDRPGRLLASAALAKGIAYAAVSASLTWALVATYDDLPTWVAALVAVSVAVVVLFTFGEALPRTVALQNPERVALASARGARRITETLHPVAVLLSALWRWGMALAGGKRGPAAPWVTEDEYDGLFGMERPDPEAERQQEALIEAVEHFAERIVREVMVPRTDMVCLEDDVTVGEALDVIEEAGYSRLPVFHETLDDIRGVLYAKDLLLETGRGCDPSLRISGMYRPAYFVPETKPVRELLVEMRRTSHIAMVADEYGGTAGLVTIEDLLEEIVGEIFDEYDLQVPMWVDLGEGRYRVDARLSVADLNEAFALDVEREADSVGGLFIEEVGHIPVVGEECTVDGLHLKVEDADGQRIRRLVVEPQRRATDEEEEG